LVFASLRILPLALRVSEKVPAVGLTCRRALHARWALRQRTVDDGWLRRFRERGRNPVTAAYVSTTTEPTAASAGERTAAAAETTASTVSTPASPAARERVNGQSPGKSGSRRQ